MTRLRNRGLELGEYFSDNRRQLTPQDGPHKRNPGRARSRPQNQAHGPV